MGPSHGRAETQAGVAAFEFVLEESTGNNEQLHTTYCRDSARKMTDQITQIWKRGGSNRLTQARRLVPSRLFNDSHASQRAWPQYLSNTD
jgi:hypothetical protein